MKKRLASRQILIQLEMEMKVTDDGKYEVDTSSFRCCFFVLIFLAAHHIRSSQNLMKCMEICAQFVEIVFFTFVNVGNILVSFVRQIKYKTRSKMESFQFE